MSNVLISGGTGMIGKKLSSMLLSRGYKVSILSRRDQKVPGISVHQWDVENEAIDESAISEADHIVHLAGAGIADSRWTADRKKEIYNSRILSTRLLVNSLNGLEHHVRTLISTSAVGIYGDSGDRVMQETDEASDAFLAKVCVDWEKEAEKLTHSSVRLVIPRIGIVLAKEGGALPELNKTTNLGFASFLGNGRQYYSWIHIQDLCEMLIFMIENPDVKGPFNAVAPYPVTNKELVTKMIRAQKKMALIVPAPQFALRLLLGEMADMILKTQRCSADKIKGTGFQFRFPHIEEALGDLFGG